MGSKTPGSNSPGSTEPRVERAGLKPPGRSRRGRTVMEPKIKLSEFYGSEGILVFN